MRHVVATGIKDRQDAAIEASLVHYEGPGLVAWATLCGHVDRLDYKWEQTNKRVNCPGCLDVVRHVKGIRRTS